MALHRRNLIMLGGALVVALTLALSGAQLLAQSGKVELILITHGHGDHVGTANRPDGGSDAVDLAKLTGAKVFGPAGLIQSMIDIGWLTAEQGVRFGKSGKVQPLGPQITITQVRAEHSSEMTVTDPATKKSTTYVGGEP